MARKKIVFIIVEGPSDNLALGGYLTVLFSSNTVFVQVMHRDITSEKGVNAQNIVTKIQKEIRQYINNNHYNKSDLERIIHIMDTDGTFVSQDHVEEDRSLEKPYYTPVSIKCKNRENIISRNDQKASVMSHLAATNSIWNIPYKAYYMSSNLDHVLYDKQNSTAEEKEKEAFQFAKRYRKDINGFIKFMSCSAFSVVKGYQHSWTFIKDGTHSLERHSNLALCFPDEPVAGSGETGGNQAP